MARILVAGIYLADHPNNAPALIAAAAGQGVTQRWIALELAGPGRSDLPHTVAVLQGPQPKYRLLDRLTADAAAFDWVLLLDDDIELAPGFLPALVEAATRCDLTLCQPARTADSEIEHPITVAVPGLLARRTRFVEIGPCVLIRRDAVPLILPFGEVGMGWGLDLVWPVRIEAAGLAMGIVDAVPVAHRMRKRGSTYDDSLAWDAMQRMLAVTPHLAFEQAFTELARWPAACDADPPNPMREAP